MYVNGHVNIFDMVDIDLFTVVALNMTVVQLGYTSESEPLFYIFLKSPTSLDEWLYALACEEDVRCLATFVRSFKLTEVYIKHGVTAVDSYRRPPPWVRATIEDITDEPGSIAPIVHRSEKMLLLTNHDSSEPTKELVCESVTPRSLPEHDSSTPCKDSLSGVQGVDTQDHVLPTIQSQFSDINLSFVSQQATASHVIDDVMRQLSFEEIELDVEACFVDVAGSGVDSSGLNVGPTQEPILVEVSTQEPIMAEEFSVEDVVVEDCVSSREDGEDAEQGNGKEDKSAPTDGQFFYDDEGIDTAYETKYDVQSRIFLSRRRHD
ncbi:hypothetical protein Tco_1180294 [Tanacetum coccineum]